MTSPKQSSGWPAESILLFGTFGPASSAGRRFHKRGLLALAVLVAVHLSAIWIPRQFHPWFWPASGVAFSYIAWEWWRYVASLDELERRLQMEAAAWTYIVGIAAAMALGGVNLALRWNVNPAWLILLEPLRAWRLYRLSRRFE